VRAGTGRAVAYTRGFSRGLPLATVIDEKLDAIEVGASVTLGQKPPRRPFRRRRKETRLRDFVRFRIIGTVQRLVVVDADHCLVDRKLIRTHRRN
jgi:hypothetical protein